MKNRGSVITHSSSKARRSSARFAVCVFLFLAGAGAVNAQTLPGTQLENIATVNFTSPIGAPAEVDSNQVDIFTILPDSDAAIDFIKIDSANGSSDVINSTSCQNSTGSVILPDPVLLDGSTVTVGSSQLFTTGSLYHTGEPMFIRLEDLDQNLDGLVTDTIAVTVGFAATGDSENLTLTESGPNTGVFVGYIPTAPAPAVTNDCMLQVSSGAEAQVSYTDPTDGTDIAASSALVDPLGIVFDSGTGQPIDGAEVTIIDVSTGMPAVVLGDDGVSTYPAQVISGGVATDSSGTNYIFDPGQFRFPLIAPGTYRLEVVPPTGYSGPSIVPIPDLQNLAGAPFALVPASFGNTFVVSPGPVINIDIPLDPSSAELFLQKSTPVAVAAPGDFVEYNLRIDNANNVSSIVDVRISDRLPPGFRFVSGSAAMDGNVTSDPVIDSDGRSLVFLIGDLNASESREIRYVAEVTSAVEGKEATNTAIASGAGAIQSNIASTTIALTEDLFASNSILIGRVIEGSCDEDVSNDLNGLANTRIYLEDGRYAITDEGGRFHFEGLEPGAHVVQLDVDSLPRHLEVFPCQNNTRFAGRSFSQFVDLRPGSLWRADFYVQQIPPPGGEVSLSLNGVARGDMVDYTLTIAGTGDVGVDKVRGMVMLPDLAEYITGSSNLNNESIANPDIAGQMLTWKIGDRAGQWSDELKFSIRLLPDGSRERVTKAMSVFNTPTKKNSRTPLADNLLVFEPPESQRVEWVLSPHFATRKAELKAADKSELDEILSQLKTTANIRVRSVGHTDNVKIAPQNRHEYSDNYALSMARARTVGNYLRDQLGLPPSQITVEGKGMDVPVADNGSEAGRAQNRRVELMIWAEQQKGGPGALVETMSRLYSGEKKATVTGKAIKPESIAEDEVERTDYYADSAWVDRLEPGIDLLLPIEGANPAIPSLKIAVKHAHGQKVAITINDELISGIHYDGITRNSDKTVAISRWRGANIDPGDNELVVEVSDKSGATVSRIVRNVHFSGGPVRAELNPEASRLVADGRSRPRIVLDMFDREDYPARPDAIGIYHVESPYRSQWEVDAERENQLIVVGDRDPVYTINEQGQAVIELEPTSRAGEVVIQFQYENQLEQEVRTWLKPAARDWILVGIAEGTMGYNDIKDNLRNAEDDGLDEDYYDDGRIAFFAKGRVKGDYLLTLAYDTKGDREKDRDRLFGIVDPDRFYTLYGDATEQRFDAASQEKLYLKIERGQFYALFGDHETGLTVTELSRYNRTLNGFKSEYYGKRFSYSAFAARTDQAFIKDEIPGDGTSGLYQLSRKPLIINSEKITIEVRDRFHTEQIIESRSLSRHVDYNIDYLNGTLFFKQPVTSRDQLLNPVFIVADYESRDQQDEETTAGGRVALKFSDGRFEIGASAISEGVTGGDGELYGADLKVEFRPGTELRAEYATSESVQNGLKSEGDAYLVELRHQGEKLEGSIYTREQESDFGLGQQRGTESGTRKTGMYGRWRLSTQLTMTADVYQQENLGTDSTRQVAQGEVRYQSGVGTFGVGLRSAVDEDSTGQETSSEQVFVNASVQALDNRLTLRGSSEFSLGDNANTDFPRRTLLGMDYRLNDHVTAFAEHEIAEGDTQDAQTSRAGVRITPWERATINASVNQQTTEFGPRVFANVGLIQGWQLNDKWTMDAGLDHGNTIRQPGFVDFDTDTPPTSGAISEDFTAVFLGALYRSDFWSASSRLEYRNSDSEERKALLFGLYREEEAGKGFTLNSQIFDSKTNNGNKVLNADIRLGWSYRPSDSKWVVFDRLDLVYDDVESLSRNSETWKVVNNINANWMYSRDTQIEFQYGAKYVRTDVGEGSYSGFTDLAGVSWRHDLSQRWDLGLHGHVRHSWRSDVYDYSLGVEGGLTFAKNAWLSLGYNFTGFEDDDFSQAGYLAYGPYIRFRLKADQYTLDDLRRGMLFRREDPALMPRRRHADVTDR